MSNKVLTWVWDHSDAKGPDLLLLLALADQGNDEGWSWPSRATLLRKTRMSVNTLDRALTRNITAGRIQRVERPGSSNRFRVMMTAEPSPTLGVPQDGVSPRMGDPGLPQDGGGGLPQDGGAEPSVNPKVEPTLFPTTAHIPGELRAVVDRRGFDDFWAIYPKKSDKGAARRAWPRAIKAASVAVIISGAERYRSDPNRDPQFTKNPATWLNAEAWDNDPLPPRLNGNGHVVDDDGVSLWDRVVPE